MTTNSVSRAPVQQRLSMYDGVAVTSIDVPAFSAGRGLSVHRITDIHGNVENAWTITHVASGRRVYGPFKTRKQALAVAARLQRIRGVNWAKPFDGGDDPYTTATWGPPNLGLKVRTIADEVCGVPKQITALQGKER